MEQPPQTPASQSESPPQQPSQQPPPTSVPPPPSSSSSSHSTFAPSAVPSSPNTNPNVNPRTPAPLPQQQQAQLPQSAPLQSQQSKQQQTQSNFQTAQIRTPFNRPWSHQPQHFSQFSNSASPSPVPSSAALSSASAPPPRGGIAIGVPAHRPTATPPQPTSLPASFSPSSFAAQYGGVARTPVSVPESMARPSVHGMQSMGMMAPQIHPGAVAVHHQQRPVQSSARPQTPSNSQSTAAQNFQGQGLVRTSSVGSPSPSGTSQALPSQNQPWLASGSHGRPPIPTPAFRPQASAQSLQQRSHIVQQSHQAMPAALPQQHSSSIQQHYPSSSQQHHPASSQQQHPASSQRQHPLSSQQLQQPTPSSNQLQEHHSQQLASPRITQAAPNQQQVTRVQALANQKSSVPASAQTNDRTAAVEADESGNRILSKRSIQELVNQVDPSEKLDIEVEDILVDIAEEFIDSITTFGCSLAKHRKSNTLEAKDILLHLERNWNMTLPGFSGDEIKPYKKPVTNDIHRERLAVIRKSMAGNDVVSNKSSAGQAAGNVKARPAPNVIGS